MSIVEKLDKIDLSVEGPKFSFEFFPPKTQQGIDNLYDRIERMNLLGPQFIDITWGAGGTTSDLSLEMANNIQKQLGVDTCLHLTCTNMTIDKLDQTLEAAKAIGIKNILALRGDPPKNLENQPITPQGSQLQFAIDLVKYIEKNYPGEFCIGVAAYPEGQPDSLEPQRELEFLKQKVDAGAKFIISQFFYNSELFVDWYQRCREYGIKVPIIPGIMPIQNYQNFRRLTNLCKSNISVEILKKLNEIQFDDEKVKEFGIQLVTQLVKDVSQKCPDIKCYHFFTLNLERSIKKILSNLNWGNNPTTGWNPMTTQLEAWDDFPNGRFGDSRSPAFGEIDGYGTNLKLTPFEAIQHWGYPVDISDITRLFVQFLEDKIPALPWTDRSDIRAESKLLINELIELNKFGLWTISSQPPLNGIPSDHPELGWGPKGGFLYQKSFIEFFCTSEFLINLQSSILKTTSQDLTYLAVNNKKEFKTNLTQSKSGEYDINTVTWGVFTSREIIQPTQIDKESFLAFSEEAFQLWNDWSLLYPPKSKTNQFLNNIGDEVWLVNIVQNDYFKGFNEFVEFLVNCGNH